MCRRARSAWPLVRASARAGSLGGAWSRCWPSPRACCGLSLAIAAGLLGAIRWRTGPAPPGPKVVAVLPLSGAAGDPQTESLAAGVADALITTLSNVPGPHRRLAGGHPQVPGPQAEPDDIARELGATHARGRRRAAVGRPPARHRQRAAAGVQGGPLAERLRRHFRGGVHPAEGGGGRGRAARSASRPRRRLGRRRAADDQRGGLRRLRPGPLVPRAPRRQGQPRPQHRASSRARSPRTRASRARTPGWARRTGEIPGTREQQWSTRARDSPWRRCVGIPAMRGSVTRFAASRGYGPA